MSLEISVETEARVKDEANRQGLTVDALLVHLIDERRESVSGSLRGCGLPVWNLGGIGALHRRDIYDDVG
jgi:hypothetical protein